MKLNMESEINRRLNGFCVYLVCHNCEDLLDVTLLAERLYEEFKGTNM